MNCSLLSINYILFCITKNLQKQDNYLGRGHLPLRRSSSTYWCSTSWNRFKRAVTAKRPARPPSIPRNSPDSSPSNKENCSNVSKHVFANSSRNLCSLSPSEMLGNLNYHTQFLKY